MMVGWITTAYQYAEGEWLLDVDDLQESLQSFVTVGQQRVLTSTYKRAKS